MSNRNVRRPNDSSDDEDDRSTKPSSSSSAPKRSINEALKRALDLAANPGDGDEDPEVLPPPSETNHADGKDNTSDTEHGSMMDVETNEQHQRPVSGGGSIVASARHSSNAAVAASSATTAMDSDDDDDYDPQSEAKRLRMDTHGAKEQEANEEEDDSRWDAEAEHIQQMRQHHLNNPLPLDNMRERAKYIPLRLTYEERKTLRLVTAAIAVSDYTNIVDVPFKQSTRRQHVQLQQIVAFLTGLISAMDYEQGQQVLQDRNFQAHEPMLRDALEIFRRYKIINPDKFRSEYGKLIYLMQDSLSENVLPLLEISLHKPIRTVYTLLEEHNALALLDDPLITIATNEILPDKAKSRQKIQKEIREKEQAAEILVRRFKTARLSADHIRQCLYSLGDNVSFLNANRKPVLECIDMLQEFFHPSNTKTQVLGIVEGQSGARLTHSHETQYHYVLQSLTLWANILEDMYRLWYLAEQELLNSTQSPYVLANTGQGLQRVQKAPRVFAAMHDLLVHTQRQLTLSEEGNVHVVSSGNQGYNRNWVGTSVVHLGDHNVPNALVFIDKYAQVSRILTPLITTLKNLENLVEENAGLERYIANYGGLKKAKRDILQDFFTHGFDGSGGDNFFDAGSCIDGRLTSAWHWCSQLASKPFYPLFKLTGFASFDGEFDK